MLDELAQYAARLEAARTDGGAQLAAFLMTLHSYARNNPGVAIVLTLASSSDAFGKQTEQLTKLVIDVRGEDINEDDALGLGEKAVKGVASVVARDAVQITPVQASEISAVFAKRLFVSINSSTAQATAEEYTQMYRRNAASLPDEATTDNYNILGRGNTRGRFSCAKMKSMVKLEKRGGLNKCPGSQKGKVKQESTML